MRQACAAVLLIVAGIVFSVTFHGRAEAKASSSKGTRNPVIVELFTSEGCSSCPPADEFLTELEKHQPIANVEVIALEQHVDYWDNLGWADPFSSSKWTDRQYVYSVALGNGNAYTPQMVVDGQDTFAGSRQRQARAAIDRAASREKVDVSVTTVNSGSDRAQRFSVRIAKLVNAVAGDTPEVWMAITETGLHSDVKRGENAGEDLHHSAVVRMMHKIGTAVSLGETSFSGEESVKIDPGWKRKNVRFVVFVQEKKSKRILGAGTTMLEQ